MPSGRLSYDQTLLSFGIGTVEQQGNTMSATAVNKLSALVFIALLAVFPTRVSAQEQVDKEFWLEMQKFAVDDFFREMKVPDENTLRLRRVFIWISSLIVPYPCYDSSIPSEIDKQLAEIDRITEIAKINFGAGPELVSSMHKDKVQAILQELSSQLKTATRMGENSNCKKDR